MCFFVEYSGQSASVSMSSLLPDSVTTTNTTYPSSETLVASSNPVEGMHALHNVAVDGIAPSVLGGPVVSPTLPHGNVQYIPQQCQV